MTKQEAIKELKLMRYNDANTGDMDRALAMAIEVLEIGHAQCNDCHYRYHWVTQRMNGQNGGATA